MVKAISNFSVPDLNYMAANGGKMSVPVNSSSLIFSHLQHISGIPAPEGTEGIAINKLHLLDVLIEKLNQIKNGNMPANFDTPYAKFGDMAGIDSSIDNLIESYNSGILKAKADSEAIPYIPSPNIQAGTVFNLVI